MINILEINPNPNDAMSLYRGRGPLMKLQKKYRNELQFHPSPHTTSTEWDYLNIFDLVFHMRPTSEHALNVIKACNRFNIPVWIDYDDLLSNIPPDNPAYFVEMNSERYQKRLDEIMKRATYITFSTEYLKQSMGKKYLDKSHVIPNGIDKNIYSTPLIQGTENKIFWRGGATHVRDIYEFRDPIIRSVRKSGWITEFMGYHPFFITDHIDAIYTPRMGKADYFNHLTKVNGKICIVPLSHRPEDIEFNKCKSNIAWIESTYAGLVTLAPDWDEWRRPGIVNYTDKNDFYDKLTSMMENESELNSNRLQSWKYIKDNLDVTKLNDIRYDLIKRHLAYV